MSLNKKIRYIGKIKVIDDEYVLKKKKKDINYLYQRLESNDFYNFPELIDEDDNFYKYKFIEEIRKVNIEDTLELLGTLHSKTSEKKLINKERYDEVYLKLNENLLYLKKYYEDFVSKIEVKDYCSPSEYLFIRNVSKLLGTLKFCETEISKWKKLIENKNYERVSVIHNNPSLKHSLVGKEKVLLNFDDYKIDSPVIDLYKFYKNEGFNIGILNKLSVYERYYKFDEEEHSLFKILVTLPRKIILNKTEFENVKNVQNFVENLYKIEEFVTKKDIKEETKNEL